MADWYKCKFLESSENLKSFVKKRFGKELSSTVARDVVSCLQQGRLFYEAASSSPLEIRPLQQFYGMVGFAKALIVAKEQRSLSTLKQAHGLKDISTQNSKIADLKVKILNEGTFQEFNDAIAPLTKFSWIDYSDDKPKYQNVYKPAASSRQLEGSELSLKGVLSRIPRLDDVYAMTFEEAPLTAFLSLGTSLMEATTFQLQIEQSGDFDSRESLKEIVTSVRTRFPFLTPWRLQSARVSWGNTTISFRNTRNTGIDEFSEAYLREERAAFEEVPIPGDNNEIFAPGDEFQAVGGGYGGGIYAIAPVGKLYLSEFSLHYLGLYQLSSLVRYRPQIWTGAISRSSVPGEPTDDRALSLIERFLDVNSQVVPEMIIRVLNPAEDR